ncbi:MAG: DEAD/DEAH box helicase family protein [Victivallales bacterium]|nr:DEAD/DEAH box helicase family protein [Victivallales bacterium]
MTLDYMREKGGLRPVQIDAIETYLFLKIACDNRPLHEVFATGRLNTLDADALRVSQPVRDYLKENPASLALLQVACQPAMGGKGILAPALKERLEAEPQSVDAPAVFRELFYGIPYTDYLFSLPMGAGKTFLMAAFIYLDLSYSLWEPDETSFARNFLILAPSGLKSSIVPSLRTIQGFDPSWVVPEPYASQLRRELKFVVLDADATEARSNRVRNPNVQKLASLQPYSDLAGLVAVTNAEKVILDHLDESPNQLELIPRLEEQKIAAANELRATIGKLPGLSIFIDEAHHAATSEIKLRSVVSKWAESGNVRTVLGFSGTPYLPSTEKIPVGEGLEFKTIEIANTVFYYPLVDGIGVFLKKPVVEIVRDAENSLAIVRRGIEEFFDKFLNKRYATGACAKLAIYCGTIERLERQILPLAVEMCEEAGLGATAILRYHKGNRDFPAPDDAELAFKTLDTPQSPVRIVLLVQIGKEGWDCKSLAGVVLSQEGDCPTNMVLQTSCRCLREVKHGVVEEAIIVLNDDNGKRLSEQLKKQQHITLDEFQQGNTKTTRINRFDRTGTLKLPDLPFYQLRISYDNIVQEDAPQPEERLAALLRDLPAYRHQEEIQTGTFEDLMVHGVEEGKSYYGSESGQVPSCPFQVWLDLLQKESFGLWHSNTISDVARRLLKRIHEQISYADATGSRFLSANYEQLAIRSRVLVAFHRRCRVAVKEEIIPATARLLRVERFTPLLEVPESTVKNYIPNQVECGKIVEADAGQADATGALLEAERKLKEAEEEGIPEIIAIRRRKIDEIRGGRNVKDNTYHYLPYHLDSGFERTFLEEALHRGELARLGLEIYYNGDSSLTEFRIQCYKRLSKAKGGQWCSVGKYTPDFLVIHRNKAQNVIDACLIVETKGSLYANSPEFQDRRRFMETEFLKINQASPDIPRFQYLCLEQDSDWKRSLLDSIATFFK